MGFFDPAAWDLLLTTNGIITLVSLTVLEIVLGIDNIIFISIVAGKLPQSSQKKARFIGLSLALIFRIMLLSLISWIASLKDPIVHVASWGFSGRDLILLAGGLFLTIKTIMEIYEKLTQDDHEGVASVTAVGFTKAIIQIVILDIVFSFDSILTAVAISSNLVIMILAVVIAIIIMIIFAGLVSDFINKYQTIKMLALVFLVAIGLVLVLEAFHIEENYHVDLKAYVYVAMAFSLSVETLNLLRTRNAMKRTRAQNNELKKDE
jgi:predicted tellurium resistance membrane protein TerC